MNDKQAKRIRKSIETALQMAGIPFANVYDRKLNAHAVDSRKYKLINKETGEVTEGKALTWRLDPNCPRGIYRKVKRRVSTIRHQERAGFLSVLRDRITRGVASAVEHARAASIQREYEAVSRLPGVGVQDRAEREAGDT